MQSALRLLKVPGDTLEVMTGDYTDNFTISPRQGCTNGTAASPMTVKNYGTDTPTFSSTSRPVITDIEHWTIDGLDMRTTFELGSSDAGVVTGYANNIILKNGYLRHVDRGGLKIIACQDSTIDNWTFDNLRSRLAGIDNNAVLLINEVTGLTIKNSQFTDIGSDGIQLIAGHVDQPVDLSTVIFDDILIENNEFGVIDPYQYRDVDGLPAAEPTNPPFDGDWVGENGIDIKLGTNLTIRGNTFHGFRKTVPDQDASGADGRAIVLHDYAGNAFVDNGYSIIIEQNDFYDNQGGVGFVAHDVSAPRAGYFGVKLSNNRFRHNRRSPVGHGFTSGDLFNHIKLAANLKEIRIWHNSLDSITSTARSLLINGAGSSDISVRNNTFSNGKTQINPGMDMDYSAVEDSVNWDSDGTGAHDVTSSDIGLDSNLIPETGSVVLEAGEDVGEDEDYNGDLRPPRRSIGAFESE